jgi:hypothetical protein
MSWKILYEFSVIIIPAYNKDTKFLFVDGRT